MYSFVDSSTLFTNKSHENNTPAFLNEHTVALPWEQGPPTARPGEVVHGAKQLRSMIHVWHLLPCEEGDHQQWAIAGAQNIYDSEPIRGKCVKIL